MKRCLRSSSFILLAGNINIVGSNLVRVTRKLLETGSTDPQAEDSLGNTPLLQIQHLLCRQLFTEAFEIASFMILESSMSSGIKVNHVNVANRTLLTYSVVHGDACAPLTRLLLNFGAKVWPFKAVDIGDTHIIDKLYQEREQSSFTWFLRSLMERGCLLNDANETLYLLGTSMGEEPARMRRHVTRTMLQLGKGVLANGPLFLQLKGSLMPFWCKPQELRYQCLKSIRRSLGPKRLSLGGVNRLPLPKKLQRCIKLEERL